jgi:hypothetical protein
MWSAVYPAKVKIDVTSKNMCLGGGYVVAAAYFLPRQCDDVLA